MKQEIVLQKMNKILRENRSYRNNSINLIASENVTSNKLNSYFNNEFKYKYAIGKKKQREYAGCKYVDDIESLAESSVKKLFKCKYVNLTPNSGVIANLISFTSLLKPKQKVAVVNPKAGSHYSHHERGMLGISNLKPIYLPFDHKEMNVDLDASLKIMKKEKPDMLILGASAILFPTPLKDFRENYNKLIMYDASHVLGLVAANLFQRPLKEGADFVSTSTHKSFFGPQGGMIYTNNKKIFEKVEKKAFDVVSNHHIFRIPALIIACLEFQKHGKKYAKQIVKNSKALGQTLYDKGINVVAPHKGFTESHQILLDLDGFMDNKEAVSLLEKANIMTNTTLLPWNNCKDTGIRIGTQEMTHIGMKERDMKVIADLIHKVLVKKTSPLKISKEVEEFRKNFQDVKFSIK